MLLSRILSSYVFRFTFWYATGLSVAVFMLLAVFYAFYSYNIYAAISDSLRSELQALKHEFIAGDYSQAKTILANRVPAGARDPYYYLLVDADYRKIAGNLPAWPQYREYDTGWRSFQLDGLQGEAKGAIRFGARTVELTNGYHLLVAKDTSVEDQKTAFMVTLLLRGMAVTIILGAIGGAIISSLLLRRVEYFNKCIRSIITGNLSQRLPVTGYSGDFREMEINLNQMLDRIQSLMVGVRRVSDNIAHDLRTPLTRIRSQLSILHNNASAADREAIQRLIDEADNLLATFNAALKIAQIETGNRRTDFFEFDLRVIVHDVVELYEPLATDKDIAIAVSAPEVMQLSGDRDLLFQAVANLLDNAIKYTPAHGAIDIALSRTGSISRLVVQDNGIGIPAADRHRVFERFFRVEESRGEYPGNGLGLSLVAAVIKYHGGAIELEDNEPGLRVVVELPLYESS